MITLNGKATLRTANHNLDSHSEFTTHLDVSTSSCLPTESSKGAGGRILVQGSRGLKEHELCILVEEGQDRVSVWAASGACSPLGDLLVSQLQLRLQVLL